MGVGRSKPQTVPTTVVISPESESILREINAEINSSTVYVFQKPPPAAHARGGTAVMEKPQQPLLINPEDPEAITMDATGKQSRYEPRTALSVWWYRLKNNTDGARLALIWKVALAIIILALIIVIARQDLELHKLWKLTYTNWQAVNAPHAGDPASNPVSTGAPPTHAATPVGSGNVTGTG